MLKHQGTIVLREQITRTLATMLMHMDYLNGEIIDERKVIEIC